MTITNAMAFPLALVLVAALLALGAAEHHVSLAVTTPLPTDIPTIIARFDEMKTQIDTMNTQATKLVTEIGELQVKATNSGSGLDKTNEDLKKIQERAAKNSGDAVILGHKALIEELKVKSATTALERLRKDIMKLEGDQDIQGPNAVNVSVKILNLERKVNDMLPGVGNITIRMKAMGETEKKFKEEAADGGKLEKMIGRSLRASFRGATHRVNELVHNVTLMRQEGLDFDGNSTSEDGKSKEMSVADLLAPLHAKHKHHGYSLDEPPSI